MKKQIALLIALVVAATSVLTAGPVELEPKTMVPPTITDDDHWHFNIGMPGWFAFISGDIGLHGATSNVGVDFGQIVTHAAGIASISADVRKGRELLLLLGGRGGLYHEPSLSEQLLFLRSGSCVHTARSRASL